jgi:hypothetical protein
LIFTMPSRLTLIHLRFMVRCFLMAWRRAVSAIHGFLMFHKLKQQEYKSELKYANMLRCQRNKWTHFGSFFSFTIKPTRCTNFTNLFWHETLHVSDSSTVHRREFIHCTLSNGICHTAVYKPVWHIPLLSVQWITSRRWTVELSETCRVSCQNKFVKLVHLVGFIIKKFVTMHGHMIVKKIGTSVLITTHQLVMLHICRMLTVNNELK